jgi:hypothetical protein
MRDDASGLHLDPQNRTHIMVAKALMAALNKAATQAKSSLKMEFLAVNNIVFPGSRIDYLEREVAALSEVVSSLEQRVDSLFPQVNNAPGSVTAVTAPSTMMVGNGPNVASSSSSIPFIPFQRSQGEERYSPEAKEVEDNEHDGQTVRKRPRHGSSSSSTVQASPSPTGRLCSSRGPPAKL